MTPFGFCDNYNIDWKIAEYLLGKGRSNKAQVRTMLVSIAGFMKSARPFKITHGMHK